MDPETPARSRTLGSANERRLLHEKRDELIFSEKRVQDAMNLAKTRKLRDLRLAHEAALAAQPQAPVPEPSRRRSKKIEPKK